MAVLQRTIVQKLLLEKKLNNMERALVLLALERFLHFN